jgi:hypothetical protein
MIDAYLEEAVGEANGIVSSARADFEALPDDQKRIRQVEGELKANEVEER